MIAIGKIYPLTAGGLIRVMPVSNNALSLRTHTL